MKLALPLIVAPLFAGCGAGYSIEDPGNVQECDLAPIVHRALEEPPSVKVRELEKVPRVDFWRLHAVWNVEPTETEIYADWWQNDPDGTPQQDETEIRTRMYALSNRYMGKFRTIPLEDTSVYMREFLASITASEREILEDDPWTIVIWIEREEDGRRVERHWASIVPQPRCGVTLETSPAWIAVASKNRLEFREKVEQLRRALTLDQE